MLELKNIHKIYKSGENFVNALQGIDLQFRKSDFVSILGPSGCGKTTMLNIIGGLDHYTEGDLVIDGRSTKDYKDRDWDGYRNHRIGFVFQSYHLIPHQSVLQNVELALTLSGVSKRERRKAAIAALEQVGLKDQLRKKPSQMSGGQMQRVAIARALVNNPDIILADEPTGALDTETSVQVMEILKEISKDRLVIMVTHNPELAEAYSTRIIRMLDGRITGDTAPLSEEEKRALKEEKKPEKGKKKPSMSFATSFMLSLKNLVTKKGRTALTAFAGSIGIIGIALIFAVSQGTSSYIQYIQEDTLSSYPITLTASTVDMATLMEAFMDMGKEQASDHDLDNVYSKSVLAQMVNALNNMETMENDLRSFKTQLESDLQDEDGRLYKALTGVQYTYDFDLQVYTKSPDGTVVFSDTQQLLMDAIRKNLNMDVSAMVDMRDQMAGSMGTQMMSGEIKLWNEMLSGMDGSLISPVLEKQYEVIDGGRWPAAYNEIVLVVDKNNEVDDLTLYALGLKTEEEINAIFDAAVTGETLDSGKQSWTYEQLKDMTFKVVLNGDCFVKEENTGTYLDLRKTDTGRRYLYDNGIDVKIVGIIRAKEDVNSPMLKGSIGYTKALTEYLIEQSKSNEVIAVQKENPTTDIFTGLPFGQNKTDLTAAEKAVAFTEYIDTLSQSGKAEAYLRILSVPSLEQTQQVLQQAIATATREDMEQVMVQVLIQQMGIGQKEALEYAQAMSVEELTEIYSQMVVMQFRMELSNQVRKQMAGVPQEQLVMMLTGAMATFTQEQLALYYDEVTEFSESTLEENLRILGAVDLDNPATISLYASSFENKDTLEAYINDYNKSVEELKQIKYTDYVGLIMSAVTTIIDAITYVLIAFVAISLIVSSIMIGVITLISVQERTKEIGILRALGASKRNVSSLFNAETVIVGLAAGLLGVGVTYLLCIPINAIIYHLTEIPQLRAVLPGNVAVVLVIISVVLTLICGLIPARSAAKKDPVVALRTE
jgi:putative ABC transport system permease protein